MTIISRLELPHFQRSAGLVLGRAEFPAAEVNSSAEPNMQADGACNEASSATQESAARANEADSHASDYHDTARHRSAHQEHANEEQPECGEQREQKSVQACPLPLKPARVQA